MPVRTAPTSDTMLFCRSHYFCYLEDSVAGFELRTFQKVSMYVLLFSPGVYSVVCSCRVPGKAKRKLEAFCILKKLQ